MFFGELTYVTELARQICSKQNTLGARHRPTQSWQKEILFELPSGNKGYFRWYKSAEAGLNLNGSSQRGDSTAYNTPSKV